MNWLKEKLSQGRPLFGSWFILDSSISTEILANMDFDWLVVDTEHGPSDYKTLLGHMQACNGTNVAPMVRVADNDLVFFKRALDLGAAGVVVPNIRTAADAEYAVKCTRYPTAGLRGVSSLTKAGRFGNGFKDYFEQANSQIVTVIQIETREALENIDQIAQVDGVDVLFLGPADLSANLGIPFSRDCETFKNAYDKFLSTCRKYNKTAGVIYHTPEDITRAIADGFSFIAIGSDITFMKARAAEMLNIAREK